MYFYTIEKMLSNVKYLDKNGRNALIVKKCILKLYISIIFLKNM